MSPWNPLAAAVDAVRAWPTTAQQAARRNAMIALTECTQRRAEREDVERFLAARSAVLDDRPEERPEAVPGTLARDASISLHA